MQVVPQWKPVAAKPGSAGDGPSEPASANHRAAGKSALRPDAELDLLSLLDPKRHRVAGDWKLSSGVLFGAGDANEKEVYATHDRFVIPVEPRGSYQLTVRFTCSKSGPHKTVGFLLPVGRGCALLVFLTITIARRPAWIKSLERGSVIRLNPMSPRKSPARSMTTTRTI